MEDIVQRPDAPTELRNVLAAIGAVSASQERPLPPCEEQG